MTYQIYYIPKGEENNSRGYTLFDIEYYQKQSDKIKVCYSEITKDWYSEIHCLPVVEGIAYFLKDAFSDKDFIFEDFVKEAGEIQEIRGLLYERYDNKPKPSTDANHFHYHVFGKVLKEKIEKFANKYGLFVNID
jgi:hypothetical protein